MNRAPVQYFDPKTGQLLIRPLPPGRPLAPPPIQGRRRSLRGFGDVPATSGAAGPLIPGYTETGDSVWNPPSTNNGGGSGSVDSSTAPTANPSQTGYLPGSAPYGESDRAWTNPTSFATVPINAQTGSGSPVLSLNYQRNALIIQNGSTASIAGDVAPTLYIGFNAQPQIGGSLALGPGQVIGSPGQGIAWDVITPRDSIYVAFGPFINTSGSVVIQGCVIQGTYSP